MYLAQTSAFVAALLLAPLPASASLECKNIRVKGHSFNMNELSGPHSVVTSKWESGAQTHINTTYTVDFCQPLKKSGKSKKDEECPNGTRVCAIERMLKGDTDMVSKVVSIAGNLENHGGSQFEYEPTRLKTSDSNSDSKKEGLRLVLKGGKHPLDGPVKERREQKAVIEFLCDPEKTGLENEWESEDRYEGDSQKKRSKREDKDDDKKDDDEKDGDDKKEGDDKEGDDDEDDGVESGVEHQLIKDDAALIWESYGPNEQDDADVLRLTWYTKHACEKRDESGEDEDGGSKSAGWGFFTWLIIIAFLGIASYLIFGSWLNYNRYGARGWDLIPHGDTLRDIPYLAKDWVRRALNTVQGTGSRGGYSAV